MPGIDPPRGVSPPSFFMEPLPSIARPQMPVPSLQPMQAGSGLQGFFGNVPEGGKFGAIMQALQNPALQKLLGMGQEKSSLIGRVPAPQQIDPRQMMREFKMPPVRLGGLLGGFQNG